MRRVLAILHVSLLIYWRRFADFWTTRCTRCPAALDSLNAIVADNRSVAAAPNGNSVPWQGLSICCGDDLDGAREILDATAVPRWNAMKHYFMAFADKERAKLIFGFRQVPFYVAFSHDGKLLYSGNKSMDWLELFQERPSQSSLFGEKNPDSLPEASATEWSHLTAKQSVESPTSTTDQLQPIQRAEEPTLIIDDMNF
jgi:hypothetical protein